LTGAFCGGAWSCAIIPGVKATNARMANAAALFVLILILRKKHFDAGTGWIRFRIHCSCNLD
jgi:hypothetical protein